MLLSNAAIANENGYTRPSMKDEHGVSISEGRHPVIEKHLPIGESYVANDVTLDQI